MLLHLTNLCHVCALYLYSSNASIKFWYMFFLWRKKHSMYLIPIPNSTFNQSYTLTTRCAHLKCNAAKRSFMATWHSYSNASAQSSNSKVKATCGSLAVAGHSCARTIVTTTGSQEHFMSVMVCSTPKQKQNMQYKGFCIGQLSHKFVTAIHVGILNLN